jgi:tetratricopeptide (TPR) repeat protein
VGRRDGSGAPGRQDGRRGARRFPSLLRGTDQPADNAERLGFAALAFEQQKFALAARLSAEALDEARKTLPKDDLSLAPLLVQIGRAYLEQGEWAQAEPFLREGLAIRERIQPDSWTTFNAHLLLGESLLGQKKYAEAEALLLTGYHGMKARETTIPPLANDRLPEAFERLIELYTATNNPDAVKKWQAEQASYHAPAPSPRQTK